MLPSGLAVLGKSGLGTEREGGGDGGAEREKRERERREREREKREKTEEREREKTEQREEREREREHECVRSLSSPPSSCAHMRSDTRGRDGGVKECRLTREGHVQGRRIVAGQCLQNAGYFRYRFRRKVCGC